VKAEYRPMSDDLRVASVLSMENFAATVEFELEWGDVFDIDASPAVFAEEGLEIGPEVFGRLTRLQQ
jgi:hypothetical protein